MNASAEVEKVVVEGGSAMFAVIWDCGTWLNDERAFVEKLP